VASANQLLDMKEAPDGFFCANDSSAVSVIQCSKSKLINIPEDLKVVGFNDDPVATIIDPQLSTIGHPAKEMGEIAAEHVLSRDRSKPPETVILETKLIIRGSTVSVQDRITI